MSAHTHDDQPHAHISSMGMLLGVFASLILLTILTVVVAGIDFGEFNLFIALAVATVKACLVALFFMHLRYDTGFNRLAFFASFFFIALFVGITMMDSGQYQSTIDWQEKVLPQEGEAK